MSAATLKAASDYAFGGNRVVNFDGVGRHPNAPLAIVHERSRWGERLHGGDDLIQRALLGQNEGLQCFDFCLQRFDV